jgi:hypothetical protein
MILKFIVVVFVILFTSCTFKQQIKPKPIKKLKIEKKVLPKVKTKPVKEKKIIKKSKPIIDKKRKVTTKPIVQSIKKFKKSTIAQTKYLDDFKFDFIKKGIQDDNTLLIIGGIQGDEPGGFMAASLFSTHYTVSKGSVWIIPNLNFYSIIKRSRGPYGDMNRKFAKLSKSDPEYKTIQRIKNYITKKDVKLILNLHDGSGYYRNRYIDKQHNPKKWGQSVVIDQKLLSDVKKYNNTHFIASQVVEHLNKHLLDKKDIFSIKNTHTRFEKTHEEQEMAKTLTYFAVTNGKSAFAHETSKSLSVSQRVYYKLLAIEKYMDIMGIKYTKKFKLTQKDVKKALNDDIKIELNDTKIIIPLKGIRDTQNFFPINKDEIIEYLPNNPLLKIVKNKNTYTIFYGNRRLTRLKADYSSHLNVDTQIDFIIDGVSKKVNFGDTITVKNNFIVKSNKQFRVNVIGYKNNKKVETDIKIYKNEFIKRYSLEKNALLYRIEFYNKKQFVGMILVKYN